MQKLNETDKIQAIHNSGVLSKILDVIPVPGVWIPLQNPVERPPSNLTKSYKALLHASDQCEKLGVAADHKKRRKQDLKRNILAIVVVLNSRLPRHSFLKKL